MANFLEAVYTNDKPAVSLRSAEDVDQFVDELLSAGWEHTAATVYALDDATDPDAFPDHELLMGVDGASGLGALRFSGEGTWYSLGEQTNPAGVEFAYFGTGHDFPADAEVPLALVRQAVAELLDSGGKRPECVRWQRSSTEVR